MTARAGGLFISGAVVCALASSMTASAQQSAAPPAKTSPPLVIQVGLDLIQIDASVTDKSGRPVADLRAEDFVLEVDGRKQPIANAAHFGQSPPAAGGATKAPVPAEGTATPAASAADPYAETVVVFVVDDLNMSYQSMYNAKRQLARFASELGASRPLMALRKTSDEDLTFPLYRSADRFKAATDALKYNVRSSKEMVPGAATAAPVFMGAPRGSDPRDPKPVQILTPSLTPTEEKRNLDDRAFTLVSTINTLRGIPGRKAVVLVSEGFWVDNETRERFGTGFPLSSVFDDSDVAAALRMVTEVANRASVVLYPVDPRGMTGDSPSVADRVAPGTDATRARWESRTGSEASLQYLAEDTGGLATATRDELKGGFGDVLRDQAAYYLIGFEPPQKTFVKSSGRPRFHKIHLSVNRPGLRVRTRAGFYGVTDDEVIKRAPLSTSPDF